MTNISVKRIEVEGSRFVGHSQTWGWLLLELRLASLASKLDPSLDDKEGATLRLIRRPFPIKIEKHLEVFQHITEK